jgi:RNA polymerase sigma-70 factor (ECF subfamily)
MSLAAAFRAARKGPPLDLGEAQLEETLSALAARGRGRWTELPISAEEMATAIAERAQTQEALAQLHAEDLHLALACARNLPGAVEAFDRHFLAPGPLRAALHRIDPSPAFVDEVKQAVRMKLFVPSPGRIAEYSGRGSLAAWTRVVAMRIALDLRPQRAVEPAREDAEAAERDPELRILQERYGKEFEQALMDSFAHLDDEQTNLLRLQIVDGLSTGQIAALFHVDRSTIKRRLAATREKLLEHTREALRDKLGLTTTSFQSLVRVLQSQMHLSVARILARRP